MSGLTERDLLDMLHVRYGAVSMNARRYAVAEHVADQPSWALRRADFIAQDCYQGTELHGHEVKVSRSDWLRELADPGKAETFARYCDRWWLVVSDKAIVKPGELPEGWGLLAVAGRSLRCITPAPVRAPEPVPARFRAALLRATYATASARAAAVGDRLVSAGPGECGQQHEQLALGNVCAEPAEHDGQHIAVDGCGRPEYFWSAP